MRARARAVWPSGRVPSRGHMYERFPHMPRSMLGTAYHLSANPHILLIFRFHQATTSTPEFRESQ
ncbi:hypothetical protein BD310DRAFT_935080 [Dichomitus squalens]|uniref:Uncharacterized protein n=1 Tax=Dichomitus squalens TaxID=114155 RepID=A0A4Q9PL02_9APHY|nr:hypothetical protein BD310DRAFT_935080 [Dichomitus squalens]